MSGGSFAGLTATLQAVRQRRSVVVCDNAVTRNRFSRNGNGFAVGDVPAAWGNAGVGEG